MPGTLTIKIAKPDTKAALKKWYGRYLWTVHEGDVGLGWGYANRAEDAEDEAWDFVASNFVADDIDTVTVIRP